MPKGAMERLDGDGVVFADGSREAFDAIVDGSLRLGVAVVGQPVQRVGGGGHGQFRSVHSLRIQNCRGFAVSTVSPRSFHEYSATTSSSFS